MGAHGYQDDFSPAVPDDFSRNTPATANRGKMPSANPITVKIWSNVPVSTIVVEIAPCRATDREGTFVPGSTCASPLKNNRSFAMEWYTRGPRRMNALNEEKRAKETRREKMVSRERPKSFPMANPPMGMTPFISSGGTA